MSKLNQIIYKYLGNKKFFKKENMLPPMALITKNLRRKTCFHQWH